MTVLENVLVGAHTVSRFEPERTCARRAHETLEYVGVATSRPAGGRPPFGTLKRIELARALVSKPRLLLLDEPAGGLNHEEVEELAAFIQRLRDELKLTVLLVEHHMNLVMRVSDHVHVLNFGRTIASGPPQRVQRDPAVIEAYLGGELEESRLVTPLLELEDVTARYGPVQALHGVSLTVDEGADRRGARRERRRQDDDAARDLQHGAARGRDPLRRPPARRRRPRDVARLGIAHVPEGRGTFAELTVWENLRLGAYTPARLGQGRPRPRARRTSRGSRSAATNRRAR